MKEGLPSLLHPTLLRDRTSSYVAVSGRSHPFYPSGLDKRCKEYERHEIEHAICLCKATVVVHFQALCDKVVDSCRNDERSENIFPPLS